VKIGLAYTTAALEDAACHDYQVKGGAPEDDKSPAFQEGNDKKAAHNWCAEQLNGLHGLQVENDNRTYSSSTCLIVRAISRLVSGFMAKALMPAAFALLASTI
jgi:hypothetical protein